ncbi:MAG TPA: hypothetical protein VNN08_09905 [Thermoanaerobaculia bacterium]|nr:hypothetical protein [Thermoanaerobaculia bacterium]
MQTDPSKIFPPIPAGFSLPFYYASVNSIWMYYLVSPEKVAPYLQNIALEPALFDGEGLVLLNFQRYTGFVSSLLSAVNEVQLNIVAYPTVLAEQAPAISFADFLAGGEQTKTLGAYRLYVPADNPFAAKAGNELFNEPTFVTTFTYTVPDINDPSQKSWDVTCNDPTDAKQFIFTLHAEANPPGRTKSAMSPVMQYTRDPLGNVFAYEWNVFGAFESALLDCGPALVIGQSSHPMRATMQALLEGVPAAGMQTFETPPVGTSTRGYLIQPETP